MRIMTDRDYMRRAIALAANGIGWSNPNPLVGAVVVKDGEIIGEGYHARCGELHAERNAFAHLTGNAKGATIYVTLEPCCHHGKQPPCTEAIVEHGIAKVVIGSRDPNPLVSGKGTEFLRSHGIEVIEDFMREECDKLNGIFFHYITTKRPYVTMKYAMTLDGKIATHTGASKWITGDRARSHVHAIRSRYNGIMAGIGTVFADDPMLNVRDVTLDAAITASGYEVQHADWQDVNEWKAHQPVRIIIDSNLRIPIDSSIVRTAGEYETIVACATNDTKKQKELEDKGVKVIICPGEDGRVDLQKVMTILGENKIDSVLIEGGGHIHEAALRAGIVNHVCAYVAPKLFGGADAKTPVEGVGVLEPSNGAVLDYIGMTMLGDDLLLEYDIRKGMNDVYWNC